MRVVLDTNILVSALMVQMGHPAAIAEVEPAPKTLSRG